MYLFKFKTKTRQLGETIDVYATCKYLHSYLGSFVKPWNILSNKKLFSLRYKTV